MVGTPLGVNGFAGGGAVPPGVGTIGFQNYRQERGLLSLCLNLFSRVQTPWNLEPVIKPAAPWGACLYPQTGPGPPALRSTLAPEMRVDGRDWRTHVPASALTGRLGRAESASKRGKEAAEQ